MEQPTTEEMIDLKEYISILKTRRWTILVVLALVVGAAMGFSALQTPLYTAEAKVLIESSTNFAFLNLETEAEVAASEPVASLVVQDLGVGMSVEELLGGLEVQGLTETEVLQFSYTSDDPQLAQAATDSFAESYIRHRREQALEVIQEDQAAFQERIQSASNQLTQMTEDLEVAEAAGDETLVTTLENQRNILVARLGVLQQQLDDAQTSRSASIPRGQIIEAAELPTSPSSPNYQTNAILALFLGLALGTGAALLRERLDDRFRSRADVERVVGAPVLATVPKFRISKREDAEEPIAAAQPKGTASEAYRSLRTNLRFIAAQQNVRSILVTSPSAHEGKTLTCANLAVVLAQAGNRVVIVSADMRRPRLEEQFTQGEREDSAGLSGWLVSDGADVWDFLIDPGIPNVRVLPCGPVPPNPAELLTSPRLSELIETLEENCDFVIFDSPPVLAVADASIIASQVGGVLLVLDSSATHRTAGTHAKDELERVGGRILGTILNSVDISTSPYYYAYGYGPETSKTKSESTESDETEKPEKARRSRLRLRK